MILKLETNFIHQAGRTSSLLLSNQGIVYGWGLWGEGSNVSFSKKLISPTNISNNIGLNENEEFVGFDITISSKRTYPYEYVYLHPRTFWRIWSDPKRRFPQVSRPTWQ